MAGRFGIARIGQKILGASLQSLGRLVVAERFSAPAELAAISLPAPPVDPNRGPVRIVLLDPSDGAFRTAVLETIRPGPDLRLGFRAFANPREAPFLVLLFQPAAEGPVALTRWQRQVPAWLLRRPMITLRCNEEVTGFEGLRPPAGAPNALHPLAIEGADHQGGTSGAVEACWQEDFGCYVQGWLATPGPLPPRVSASMGAGWVPVERLTPEPDPVSAHAIGRTRFAAFLPGLAQATVSLLVESTAGSVRLSLPLPPIRPPPTAEVAREQEGMAQALFRFLAEANQPGSEILHIGARLVGTRTEDWRDRFPRAKRYVGMDVHPGPTIDLVGDVHALSALAGLRSFNAVFSGAVLEHLAMPWLAAVEINRVLRPGGLTYHITHQAWPVHEEPNDFWRFSDEALKLLFGEPFGFEVLNAGMADRVRLYPLDKSTGDLGLPFGCGYGSAWVLARKTRDIEGAGPAPGDLSDLARRYPAKAG